MQVHGRCSGGFRTVLEDGRGHSVVVDLPLDEEGEDIGPSALELSVMSLAGCISTIFTLIAKKRGVHVGTTSIQLEATRPPGSTTITAVEGDFRVATDAAVEEVDVALRATLRTCPVGVIFERAGIPLHVRAVVIPIDPRGKPTRAT